MALKRSFRNRAVRIRAGLPTTLWSRLEDIARLSRVDRFLRNVPQDPGVVVADRIAVYDVAIGLVGHDTVSYLEFGVHEGASLRHFANRLTAPASEFHAFDSFEGLPENWNPTNPRGTFSTGGQTPQIDDARVAFHVGWFEQTLSDFRLERRDRVLVNVDCDLYSSTTTVLDAIGPYLQAGDLVYFDEFSDVDHEFRSLQEYLASSGAVFSLVARNPTWHNVLFRVVDPGKPTI